MKIGFLTKDLKINGANRMILEFAGRLAKLGWQIALLVQDRTWNPWLYPHLKVEDISVAGRETFDGLISTYYPLVPWLDAASSKLRIQLIMDNYYRHGQKAIQHGDLIEYAYLHTRSIKLVVSYYLKNLLREKGVESHVIHVGIDHDLFFEDPAWRDGRFRVLVEGYCRDYKELPATYASIPKGYEIWGLGIEDHHQPHCDRMWVQPPQADLRKIYSACDAIIKLEKRGGFPQAPLEAMGCGTVNICSDEGGQLDYSIHEFNSLVAQKPGDVARYLSALSTDADLRTRLRENGKATARAFTWERASAALADFIGDSLGK